MNAKIDVKLRPFNVPNFVLADSNEPSSNEGASFPLSAVDAATLDRMCDEFRKAVFEKAGKVPPATVYCATER